MTVSSTLALTKPYTVADTLPAVVTMAGSDSSGGAGIEADLKTFSAHKVYGLTCITALTAQNTKGVHAVVKTPKEHMEAMLEANFSDFAEGYDEIPLKVVKTGMLTAEAVEVLAGRTEYLAKKNIKLVVDPVMIATSGSALVDEPTMQLCVEGVIGKSFLCTPNFDEALYLWGIKNKAVSKESVDKSVVDVDTFSQFVVELQRQLGCENLLVKGGHIPFFGGKRGSGDQSDEIYDILYESKADKVSVFKSHSLSTANSHGTGCTLASAISANTALGHDLTRAVALSIGYVQSGMVNVVSQLGHGKGPLNHTVPAKFSLKGLLEGRNLYPEISAKYGSFFNYLKTHPTVSDTWRRYTEHPFLKLVATNQLPFDAFLRYLEQDYYYLVNYAKIHGIAISVAPTCEEIEAGMVTIGNIIREIARHKEKLAAKYGIHFKKFDLGPGIGNEAGQLVPHGDLSPAPACISYCSYLAKMGSTQDYFGIKIALAPCLHGYAEAGVYGAKIRKQHDGSLGVLESEEQSQIYADWLGDYTSDWYQEANQVGIKLLDELMQTQTLTEQRLDELCVIFRDVSELEVNFWDEIVNNLD